MPTALPMPSAAARLGQTELRYRLLAYFEPIFYCDPDQFPVARDDTASAVSRFPEIQKDAELFSTIAQHTNLTAVSDFSSAQKVIVYHEFKKLNAVSMEAAGDSYTFRLRSSTGSGGKGEAGKAIEGTVSAQGAISVTKSEPAVLTCPICLPGDTAIDTPFGPVPVRDVRVGTIVWTRDASGARLAAPVVQTARTAVPPTHSIVRVRLSDGRVVAASPGHPTAEGRPLAQLRAGDVVDGARVSAVETLPFLGDATYDLLPAGDTGVYWANGVLLASTLR